MTTTRPYPPTGADPAAGGVPTDVRARPLTRTETRAAITLGGLVALLGVIGLVNSFHAVAEAARPTLGGLAWTLPLGIDIGLAVFAGADLLLARLDMRPRWLRLVPWSLIGLTIYFNVSAATSVFGVIAHAALPLLWIIAVEVGIHAVRVRAGLASGRRLDTIRASRWILAPVSTALLWRRMVLWEIRSYPQALARERDRILARTDLADTHGGLAWRWRAPRRSRALYRLGELAPAHTDTPAAGSLARPEELGEAASPPRAPAARSARPGERAAGSPEPGSPARPQKVGEAVPHTGTPDTGTPGADSPGTYSPGRAGELGEAEDMVRAVHALDREHGRPAGRDMIRRTLGVGSSRATRLRRLANETKPDTGKSDTDSTTASASTPAVNGHVLTRFQPADVSDDLT